MSTATTSSDSKTSSVNPNPAQLHTVTPHLVCAGAAEAIQFYQKAFGAVETARVPGPDGKLIHAAVRIGDSTVMLVDEFPAMGCLGPKSLKGSAVTIHLQVDNADAWQRRAAEAGAEVVMPVEEQFWGDRYGIIQDPFGHRWSMAHHVRDASPDEIQKAATSMSADCS